MSPISSFRQHYRLHQAYSRNPMLAMATDVAKTGCLLGVIAATAWFGVLATGQQNLALTPTATARQAAPIKIEATEQIAKKNDSTQQIKHGDVEIPAVAVSDAGRIRDVAINNLKPLPVATDFNHIYESDWILILPSDKYVIQFGSSPDLRRLYEEAKAFPTGPVAIYPFMKNSSKRLVYGYSSGVYNSLEDARRALKALPKAAVVNRPWIRPLGALKKQIEDLSG